MLLIKGLGVGGAERLLLDVVAARDDTRFDYEVAHVLHAQDTLAPALRDQGVAVHDLGATSSADLRWTLALRRLLVRGGFEVLHSHLPYSAAFGRLVARSMPAGRRPVLVYTEHSLWDRAAVLTKALNRATVGADSALLVVSDAARQALPPALQARARVITHGVNRDRFARLAARRAEVRAEVRAELGLADCEVLALTVANLRSEKGYDVLVEAARRTAAAGAPVRFVSVGRGQLEPAVARAAEAPEAAGVLVFLGPRDDTARLMVGSDLFVLPSHQEGLPVALMEAMSAGLPVVATTVGGVPGVVAHGQDGLLVPPGDAAALAAAVTTVAGDAELRARMAASSARHSERFDVRRATRTIEAVYDELLGRRP